MNNGIDYLFSCLPAFPLSTRQDRDSVTFLTIWRISNHLHLPNLSNRFTHTSFPSVRQRQFARHSRQWIWKLPRNRYNQRRPVSWAAELQSAPAGVVGGGTSLMSSLNGCPFKTTKTVIHKTTRPLDQKVFHSLQIKNPWCRTPTPPPPSTV